MSRKPSARSLVLLVLPLALAVPASPAGAELPELIPLEVLFGNPERSSAQVSPDGTLLSYLAPSEEGVLNVWVEPLPSAAAEAEGEAGAAPGEAEAGPAAGGAPPIDGPRRVTNDALRGIRQYRWAEDGRRILYWQDAGGDEVWHLYSTDLDTGITRDLTPFLGVRVGSVYQDRDVPGEILVELNLRDRRLFDVYRVDLGTGAVVLDTENPGDVVDWVVDADFRIRGAVVADREDGGTTLRVRDAPGEPWRDLLAWPFEETGEPVGFLEDGSLYVESSLGSDTTRLVRLDPKTGAELEVVAHDPRADLGTLHVDPVTGRVQAVQFDYLKSEWTVVDPAVAEDFAALDAALDGAVWGVVDRDRDDRTWIGYVARDTQPATYYAYHRGGPGGGRLELLFDTRPELQAYTLAPMKPLVIEARDGLPLVSYLTLPVGVEPRGLPLVLDVHGGPWGRDFWGYDPRAQWLANRGYAVLQVNFRASVGFGKAFLNAGNLEWGVGAMQHDLTDAVGWAIAEGIADPERVAIMGGSYGGYATLAGLAFTPDLYACGVDIVGMSNMRTVVQSMPAHWLPMKRMYIKRVGDVENDDELNRRISPLFHAEKIRAPLLIGQGANDPRVVIGESDQIVAAMRANDRPVTYVVYPDEGHGFARPENSVDFNLRADRFLAECLGGRAEPAREIPGTSAELR